MSDKVQAQLRKEIEALRARLKSEMQRNSEYKAVIDARKLPVNKREAQLKARAKWQAAKIKELKAELAERDKEIRRLTKLVDSLPKEVIDEAGS